MHAQGARLTIASIEDSFSREDSASFLPIDVRLFPTVGPKAYGFSPALRAYLNQFRWDVLHHHGMWMDSGAAVSAASRRFGSPVIVHPHGMLTPWALRHSRWKKHVVGWLWQYRSLRRATCFRALSENEVSDIRALDISAPIALIPNGVDLVELDALPPPTAFEESFPQTRGKKRLLFLSRLHPKKGLPDLLNAWTRLSSRNRREWVLILAGPNEIGHEEFLRSMVERLGIENEIIFPGPIYAQRKREALGAADAFVLPSLSEGLPMAVLEAAASRLPSLITTECHLSDLATSGAAIEVVPGAAPLLQGLQTLFALSREERRTMGNLARQEVENRYMWKNLAHQTVEVSNWLVEGGKKRSAPACIRWPNPL